MTKSRCALWLLLAIVGCSSDPANEAPTAAPITAEAQQTASGMLEKQLEVDTLYLADDGREFVAPGNHLRAAVDPATRKLAWAAWQCDNPQCPGRKADGQPLRFPWPNPFLYVKEDGSVAMRQPVTDAELLQADENREVRCPACLKIRNLASETEEQRRQYQIWCTMYVLPQAAEQRQKLAEEYRQLVAPQ